MGADQSVIPVEVYNDPKHRRKASTIVVGIIGLVLSMIGLIIGFVGLGIGILISIFVLCIFPAFYITSFALLITSLSKRVVTRQITTCCLVFGILALCGHIGNLAWAASYISSYCYDSCDSTSYFGFYNCEYWAQWCTAGIVGTIGMTIHLIGMIFLITAAGIEHGRAYSVVATTTVVTYVQQPGVQYVQQPAVQYVQSPGVQVITTNGGNGSVVLSQPGVQYVQSAPVAYVAQPSHGTVQYVQSSPHASVPPTYSQALNH